MIRIFFGRPGVGKSTLAVKLAMQAVNERPAYLNFANTVPGCHTCNLDGLGKWTFKLRSWIGIDESSIEYNNRAYKSMRQDTIAWFKKYRHEKDDIDFFSQSWEDTDITIRRLADQLWYMYKLGPWTLCRRVYKRVTVDKQTEQIIDGYKMAHMAWLFLWPLQLGFPFQKKFMLTFRPFYYRYFDSYERLSLPEKDFPVAVPLKKNK